MAPEIPKFSILDVINDYPEIVFVVGLAAGVVVGTYLGRRYLIAELKMLGAARRLEATTPATPAPTVPERSS